jgi:hypothetical protein
VALNTCQGSQAALDRWSGRRFWVSASPHWRDLCKEANAATREPQTCGRDKIKIRSSRH